MKEDEPDSEELQKGEPHIMVELIKYVPDASVSKTILNKVTGNIFVMSVAMGETIIEKISPFDTFIQIIDGEAQVIINKQTHSLKVGDGIIIPGHSSHSIHANQQFKMISTVIKSGYEEF